MGGGAERLEKTTKSLRDRSRRSRRSFLGEDLRALRVWPQGLRGLGPQAVCL